MGGRGAKAGSRTRVNVSATTATPTQGGVAGLVAAFGGSGLQGQGQNGYGHKNYGTMQGDYDGGGNPELKKWQAQSDDSKAGSYLSKISRDIDVNSSQYADGYQFYDNPYQKMVLAQGLNQPATLLNNKDFNTYVKQTGAEVMYRGVSGQSAKDRMMYAKNSHTGNGVYGDGYYFTPDKSVAKSYAGSGGKIIKMALAPTARVIQYNDLQNKMAQLGNSKLARALGKAGRNAGSTGSRTFGSNSGEMQYALKLGYNVIQNGNYLVAGTRDAFVINKDY